MNMGAKADALRHERSIAAVLGRYPEIAAAWLFGSTARGDAGPNSDLDVGIVFRRRGATGADHHRLLGDLTARLEQLAARPVDVVVLETQGPIFCHRVLREGRCVYEADRDRRVDFESTTYVRYLDYRPTWEIAARHALDGVRDWLETRR